MKYDFVVIDFETANESLTSVCQVGIACFKDNKHVDGYSSLINPETHFSAVNESIHGIKEKDVRKAPTFKKIYNQIFNMLNGQIVVTHTPFDRSVMDRLVEEFDLKTLDVKWLDNAKVVRRTFDEFAYSGYGLSNVAEKLNIDFTHHDALEDAIATGKILVECIKMKNIDVDEWIERVRKSISGKPSPSENVKREGNPDGIFYGESIVFTGSLSMTRSDAADKAAQAGADVASAVSKKISILVVGDQDIEKLKQGNTKSTKHLKAEKLIKEGYEIRILGENDFLKMVS